MSTYPEVKYQQGNVFDGLVLMALIEGPHQKFEVVLRGVAEMRGQTVSVAHSLLSEHVAALHLINGPIYAQRAFLQVAGTELSAEQQAGLEKPLVHTYGKFYTYCASKLALSERGAKSLLEALIKQQLAKR